MYLFFTLRKPMLGIFLDTETNGLDAYKNRILEIAFKIVDLETGEVKEEYHTIVAQPIDVWEASDLESLKVNGFTWERVSQGKREKTVSDEIVAIFNKNEIRRAQAVFICQNPSFDRAFFAQLVDTDLQEALKWPYHWLDLASMYWAICMDKSKKQKTPFPWETGYSKDTIAACYELPQEEKPHRAINGVNHLILCYKAVVGFPYAGSFASSKTSATFNS